MSVGDEVIDSPVRTNTTKVPHRIPSLSPTIYHEDWWLDICSEGAVREVQVTRDGAAIARLPYMMTRHLGLITCSMPPLVHFSGPTFAPMDGPESSQMQQRNDMTRELLGRLPPYDVLSLKLYHGIADTLAFQREGCKTSVQFTFEIDPSSNDKLWAAIRRGHRRLIRDAQALHTVDTDAAPDEFVAFYSSNVENAGKQFRYDAARVERLIQACLHRGRGHILLARDSTGAAKAGLFTMWDQEGAGRMYNFLGTRAPGQPAASASVLLVWAALQEASRRRLTFDFDGVYNAGQVQYFAGFGGRVTPRYIVSHASRRAKITYGLYSLANRRKEHMF